MGKLKYLVSTFLITVLLITSCQDSKNSLAQEKIYIVASKKVDCVGVGPQKCFLVKKNQKEDWQFFYATISGFEYKLLIAEKRIENPPQDSSSVEYELVKIISKIEKVSENLPI